MKKINFTLILVLIAELLFAQRENYVWYFGNGAGVDFNSGAPVALTNGMTNTYEGCATMSDSNGNLLFYTDGISVWDSTHTIMPNGDSLQGGWSSTQSALIIPFPGSNVLYYIFTVQEKSSSGNFNYSLVDMSLNNGKGDITIKNNFIIGSVHEKLTAVKHSNGTDTWVMVHGATNNTFFCFLVNSSGVSLTPVISNTGPVFSMLDLIGYMKFSPSGDKIAFASYHGYYVDLFDFNSTSGTVSNEKHLTPPLPSSNGVYGIEFSNNENYLYATIFIPRLVIQWDITSNIDSIINSSMQQVGVSSAQWLGSLQLAPDGKIYVAEHNTSFLGVINSPNSPGALCNYVDNAIPLSGKICQIGLPNFMTNYSLPTGIKPNYQQQNQFVIYPNPFTSQTTITFSEEQKNTTIKITALLGQEIKVIHFSGRQLVIDKAEMKAGIYFVQTTDEKKHICNKKIIIQ